MESHLEARLWNDVFVARPGEARRPARHHPRHRASSRRCPPRSRWTRSSGSCASTRPASTAGAGTTSSASSRGCAPTRAWCSPTAPRSTMEQGPSCAPTCSSSSRPATAAAPTPWAGWRRRSRIKTTPPPTRRRSRRSAPTSCARCSDGHDGTWVAHPGLVAAGPGDLRRAHAGRRTRSTRAARTCRSTAADLLRVPEGTRTEAGLRHNIRVGVQYLEAWLRGQGCVPLYNLMEDAATAEISPRPGLAVDPPRRRARRRARRSPSSGSGGAGRGDGARCARRWATGASPRGASRRPRASSSA